jgi:hypothetical protein
MGFPFLVVFQLGHNTTNLHILNIHVHIMKSPCTPKAKKEANLDPYSCTFKGRTTYDYSYLSWPANPRPGFHSNPMALEGKTSYTYDYWDKSRPVQPWRKSEHWPHTYSLCETHHPHKLESMPSKPLDTAS